MKATKKKKVVRKKTTHELNQEKLSNLFKKKKTSFKVPMTATGDFKEPAPKVKENRLWQWFNDGVRVALTNWCGENRLHKLHMLRVENTTMSGYSDVEACYNGTGFIAELKTLARPEMTDKRRAPTLTLPHFTTAQALFLEARWNAGERSWLFVQVGDTRYLIPGKKAHAFLKPFKEAALEKAAVDTLLGDTPMDFLLAMVGK